LSAIKNFIVPTPSLRHVALREVLLRKGSLCRLP